jgi:uncharacterized membrane protein
MSFSAITLCVTSQRVFIVVGVYFVIDSVRKLLDTLSYINVYAHICTQQINSSCSLRCDWRPKIVAGVAEETVPKFRIREERNGSNRY